MSRDNEIEYYIINTPATEGRWCYNYSELQGRLNEICKGNALEKAYVSLMGGMEAAAVEVNCRDFSFIGGHILLTFEKVYLELRIFGEGMVRYRVIPAVMIRIKKVNSKLPADAFNDGYYYDIARLFDLSFEGRKVDKVKVDKTGRYLYNAEGFDREKAKMAEEQRILPKNICFKLANGVQIGFYAHEAGNFYIRIE